MFEDETEHENANPAHQTSPGSVHQQDASSMPLVFEEPPLPAGHDQRTATSRLHPLSEHRRRSGSVPCRRPRDQPVSSRHLRAGQSPDRVPQETTTASLLKLPAISVPQIIVDDQCDQPAIDHEEGLCRSKDASDSPISLRPRCQTLSLDPSDRTVSVVLPSRTLSLSMNLSTSRTLCTGEWIRVLLQRTDASMTTSDDVSVSRPL